VITDVAITRGGPKAPVAATTARAPRSVRRTSTIDSVRPGGPAGEVVVRARARDLLTTVSNTAVVLGTEGFDATVAADRTLLTLDHPDPRLVPLVGASVAGGFRGRVLQLISDDAARLTLLNLLLDDWPGASLVSGYAMQRYPGWSGGVLPNDHLTAVTDLCAGWAVEATIMEAVRNTGAVPAPTAPPVPAETATDEAAWHARPHLPGGATRRARRLDLVAADNPNEIMRFDAHFRDSYCDADDGEGAVHEYSLRGRFDPLRRTIVTIDAKAHVLPWTECPQAIASASRVAGTTVDDLRARVRTEFIGTSTCTHLNDMLRSLADLPALAAPLQQAAC
jgi:hypothetical protein